MVDSDVLKDDVDKLKSQNITDLSSLLSLLSRPLDAIGLLPPQFRRYSASASTSTNAIKHFPAIQKALLEFILPSWDAVLSEQKLSAITDQYFCPDSFSFASTQASKVALISYSTILSLPLNEYSIRFLSRLAKAYPIDSQYQAVFASSKSLPQSVAWEDCVRNVIVVPAKVANSLGGKQEIPDELEHRSYFNHVCLRTESLIWSLSSAPPSKDAVQSVTYLLTKLAHLGLFPPYPPTSRSQPSFFKTCLPLIRAKASSSETYRLLWSTIFSALPSSSIIQSLFMSLFTSLEDVPSLDTSPQTRGLVRLEATLLQSIVGKSIVNNLELLNCVSAVILGHDWSEGKARISVCWIAVVDDAVELLLSKILEVWTSPDHIKHSLLSRHHYLTSLLLITISYFNSSSQVMALALSPSFISSIGVYIKHLDPNVRSCGMLVAEEVAQRAGKKLDFGVWDGDEASKNWARSIRDLIKARDIDFETIEQESKVQLSTVSTAASETTPIASRPIETLTVPAPGPDSDDESVEGYASSDASDRSVSPTPSDLDEIEKDPTLNVGLKKIARPVYLAQLGELVRSTTAGLKSGENDEPQKIEMALNCGDELIRRKRAFGTELEENAVNLVYAFIGLQNNFELDGFDTNRQAIVIALVACSPRKTAPSIIEEFFKNQYSTDQRFVMLTALALGARELASLPIPPSSVSKEHISFPSKKLPPALHQKLLHDNSVRGLLMDISQNAIDKTTERTAERVPEVLRERQLRLQRPRKITEMSSISALASVPSSTVSFTEIAAEFFICPFVNRFWLFLRDEQTRESRMSHHKDPLYRYRGAGTGLVLNAMVLSQFLSTLGVLIHAARNAPQWLAIIAPDGLELAVTLGTRPISHMEEEEEDDNDGGDTERRTGSEKEALVLTTALELAVVILDGCLELDGGRSLGLEHTSLLLGAGEWAGKLMVRLEKGLLVPGGGGTQEIRLRRAAAGVVLKVDEVTSKWGRSMIDIMQ